MKKIIWFLLILAALAGGGYFAWKWYFQKQSSVIALELIPKDAIFILETDDPIKSWKSFSKGAIWQHIKNYAPLNAIGNTTETITKTIEANQTLFSTLGHRTIYTSAHLVSAYDYDFLFVCDLQQVSKFSTLTEGILELLKKQGFTYTQEIIDNNTFHRFYDPKDKSTLHLYFASNQLVCSYNRKIIQASAQALLSKGINADTHFTLVQSATSADGIGRIYLNHSVFVSFLDVYMEDVTDLKGMFGNLHYTGAKIELSDDLLAFSGFTSVKDTSSGILKAVLKSGSSRTTAQEVLSSKTAFMLSLGFQSFPKFYENLKSVLKEDAKTWAAFEKNRKQIERLLRFRLDEDLLGWIDDEVTIAQYQQDRIIGGKVYTVAAMKAISEEKAKSKLGLIEKRLKLLSRFKVELYKGHEIHYMEITGLFKLLFGKLFEKIQKPYYTYLGNYVVFCDDAATLLRTVDDYEAKNTLSKREDFSKFYYHFKKSNNVFAWVNMKNYFLNLRSILDVPSYQKSYQNREFIICFPQMALQMANEDELYDTRLMIEFHKPNEYDMEVTDGKALNLEDLEVLDSLDAAESFILAYINRDVKKELYDNGKFKFLAKMKDGKLHGNYIEYWENGEVKIRGHYKHGERSGHWKYYTETGDFERKEKY